MSRGVLYLVWPGDPRTEDMLERSRASVAAVHPELAVHVERLEHGSLLDKARMADITPFEQTLYLDVDTVLLGRVDFGFEKAVMTGLACCICECPWARRYGGFSDRGDIVEYNTGVLFFTDASLHVFNGWKRCVATVDSSIEFRTNDGNNYKMPYNDQAGFALAINELEYNPFILPMNWNFRPAWHKSMFGPIKIWHDYTAVPDSLRAWNDDQCAADAVIDYTVIA